MKKLFKLLWVVQILQDLTGRGHARHGYHGHGYQYRRSHSYYPLHRRSLRRSLAERALSRLVGGRRRYY